LCRWEVSAGSKNHPGSQVAANRMRESTIPPQTTCTNGLYNQAVQASYPYDLKVLSTPGAGVQEAGGTWRLEIPAGPAGTYRLAQLDNYHALPRGRFPYQANLTIQLECRASGAELPGTWGFGLWNDPFSLSLGLGGAGRHLPALPNTAWYFFASPPNYLSLRDDLPACGPLSATFRSPHLPAALLALGAPLLGALAIPPLRRPARRLLQGWIEQGTAALTLDPTIWHRYELTWTAEQVTFKVDGVPVLETGVSPLQPLGFVLWIDNQYAAFPPDGRPAYGSLPNPEPAWIEVRGLQIEPA
jgi:hypothetical protein